MDFVNFLFLRGDINQSQFEEVKLNKNRDNRKSADIIINKGFLTRKDLLTRLCEYSKEKK
jgi:hypothetical protein